MRFLRGQAAIALSLAIPAMVGVACLGGDMWALYLGAARLQQAADAAVLAGAAYLPANPALAQRAAQSKAQMNGINEREIVYNHPATDGRSITMVVERNVPYRFARLLGLSRSLVTVKAVAGIGASSQPLACAQSASSTRRVRSGPDFRSRLIWPTLERLQTKCLERYLYRLIWYITSSDDIRSGE